MHTNHNNLYTSPATCIIKAITYTRLGGDMKRYTETELEKIVRIGKARIDQVIERACIELDGVKPAPKKVEFVGQISRPDYREAQRQLNGMYVNMLYDAGCRNARSSGEGISGVSFGGLLGGLGA